MLNLGVRYKEVHDAIFSTFVFENIFTFFFWSAVDLQHYVKFQV